MPEKSNELRTETKKDYTVYLYPSTSDMIDKHIGIADKRSRSDFLEAAVRFYCGVLDTESNKEFLGEQIISQMKAITDQLEGRIFSHFRSQDISLSLIFTLMAAAMNNMTDDEINSLRKDAISYVDENFRARSFVSALHEERRGKKL